MQELSPLQAQTQLERGAFLLDVREPLEYQEAHATGATLIPLGEIPTRFHELPKDQEIVVICRSGARSAKATEFLLEQGYTAHNLTGGTLAWLEAGLPSQKGI
jgi:rhodanese-related sulfurtransferase